MGCSWGLAVKCLIGAGLNAGRAESICVVYDPQHYSKAFILFFTKIVDKAFRAYYIWYND
jgi:hypothetical protein